MINSNIPQNVVPDLTHSCLGWFCSKMEKIAGAVTHVFTDDPTMGYGIFAETMLEQCRNVAEENKTENS